MANKVKRNFCINHFLILLQSAERTKVQIRSFFYVVDSNVTAFKDFSKENDSLNSFFANFIDRDKSYVDVWEKFVTLCPLCLMGNPLSNVDLW